ncbi:hypothetical protein GOB14_30375 [Sinorhizobium meliloti]|nr:hypothetical protein [Sinorhizobium meliloti]
MSSIEAPEFNLIPMRISLEAQPFFYGASKRGYVCGVVAGSLSSDTDSLVPLSSDNAISTLLKQIVTASVSRITRGIGVLGIATK